MGHTSHLLVRRPATHHVLIHQHAVRLRKDVEDMCKRLSNLKGPKTLAMTTNGIVLGKKLPRLKECGLTALNISLDTLVPAKFEFMTRRKGRGKVMESIATAVELGYNPVKVNCVVMRGINDDEICDFVDLTKDKPINVRFIEFMPFDGNVWNVKKLVPYAEILNKVGQWFNGLKRIQDHPTDTAKNFATDGHHGTVSFITSMTEHFCAGCNRLRLLADGNFKVCLFGPSEVGLKVPIRSGINDLGLEEIIGATVYIWTVKIINHMPPACRVQWNWWKVRHVGCLTDSSFRQLQIIRSPRQLPSPTCECTKGK